MFEDIDWYNGLLIKPQQLQTIKLLNYFRFLYLYHFFDQNCYGILDWDIDISKAHEGIIVINKLICLNKDGTLVNYDVAEDSEYRLNIDLNQESKLDSNIESIYLHMATISYNSKITGNYNRYYKSNYGPIIDDAQSEHDEYMRVLKPKPFLLFEKDILPKHIYFPIIKLKRNKGVWQVLDYIPPYLVLKLDHPFVISAKNIYSHLSKKIEELSVKIIHHKQYQALDHKTIVDIHNYEIINPVFFKLKTELSLSYLRPFRLFTVLMELLNAITFSLCRINNLDIKYDHDNMYNCLSIVINKINDIIVDVLQQNIIFINFEVSESKDKLCISIPYEYQVINDSIYCFCNSDKYDNEYLYSFIENLVIYSESKQGIVKNLRIRGIARECIKQFSNVKELIGLSGIERSACFRIKVDDQFFNRDDRLIIELDSAEMENFKFNIVLKQN